MSNGKLKAQYNRVRTSVALQSNNIWTNTIGVEQDQAGSNAAVEASLRAPTHGAGGGRAARRQRAQELIQQAGYEPSITSFEGLVALARAQGNISSSSRGACKICGGLGHLTKQCKNVLPKPGEGTSAAAAGEGNASNLMALLPGEAEEDTDLSSLSDLNSNDSDSGRERSAKKSKKRKKSKERKSKSHKSKHKKSNHKRTKTS